MQPYIASYRIRFFEALLNEAEKSRVELRVFAGAEPTGSQLKRSDSAKPDWLTIIDQREFRISGRRLVWRKLPAFAKKADVLVLEQARRNLDAYRLLLPTWLRRQKIVFWGHGADLAGSQTLPERRIRALLTRRADGFIAYTPEGARAVVADGREPDTTFAVYNSNDTQALLGWFKELTSDDLTDFSEEIGIGACNAVYLGGLDATKRIDLLLKSALLVHKDRPEFSLIIGGDGEQRELVEAFAQKHDFVKYLGRIEGKRKALALHSAQVGLCLGAIGLVAVDYLGADLPVLSTRDNADGPEAAYLRARKRLTSTASEADAVAKALLLLLAASEGQRPKPGIPDIDGNLISSEAMAGRFMKAIQSMISGSPQ